MPIAPAERKRQNCQNRFIYAKGSMQTVASQQRIDVSLVAVPDAAVSTLGGLYDVLNMFEDIAPNQTPFAVKIVGSTRSA
ncbi:MAG: hypothetical protein ACE5LB_05800, partial [Acidiferrobacterales bacterium]